METVQLTRGYVAIVDDEDHDMVSAYKWHASVQRNGVYAVRRACNDGKWVSFPMHRIIMRAPHGMIVDHINGNGIDNRKSNLRICTQTENKRNRRSAFGKSKYKGVYFDIDNGKWRAQLGVNGRRINLGRFSDELSAALAYDAAALLYFGEFARINIAEIDDAILALPIPESDNG